VSRAQAQVFTFPYSAAHNPDRVPADPRKDTEAEDIVETYEQYPLLGVDREGGTLVGRRCEPCREDMCLHSLNKRLQLSHYLLREKWVIRHTPVLNCKYLLVWKSPEPGAAALRCIHYCGG